MFMFCGIILKIAVNKTKKEKNNTKKLIYQYCGG